MFWNARERTEIVRMARLEFEGIDELCAAFGRIEDIPDEVTEEALTAMGNVAFSEIKRTGESMGVRDQESDVHILDKMKLTKPTITKKGGYADVTFSGSRTRGKKKTRNAEIAFVNEYGKRGQEARPFIGTAMSKKEKAIVDAGAEVLGDWMEKEFSR